MNKKTIVTSAFRVHRSKFSCSLAAALLGQGAAMGEEAVLADSGRVGEIAAGVGRVRNLAFLSMLYGLLLLS